jgi:hypothetical protein
MLVSGSAEVLRGCEKLHFPVKCKGHNRLSSLLENDAVAKKTGDEKFLYICMLD